MAADEIELEDGMIPIVCQCGRIYIWRIHDVPLDYCPQCRTPAKDTDDDT